MLMLISLVLCLSHKCEPGLTQYLTIRQRALVFYEQIVNEAQPSWLSLVENEGE